MDDELCDTVVMGAVQLQATFSVVAAGRSSIKDSVRTQHDGAHLSKGCTRGTTGVWCVLPSLRVLRFTTIPVAVRPRTLYTISFDALSDLYDTL